MGAAIKFSEIPNSPGSDLRALFDNSPLCLAWLDARGKITDVNPAFSRILDQSGKLEAFSFTDLIDSDLESECYSRRHEMFEGGRDSFQIESAARTPPPGRVRWNVWRVSGWKKPGYAIALAETLEDVTENADRFRQLARLESVGRLAAGVVHDFNNLLTGMLLYCDLLLATLEAQQGRKYAEEIRSAGLQAAGVVRQLLNIARPGPARPGVILFNEVVQVLRDLLCRLIGKNIQLELRLDPQLGFVRLDCTQAQQILLNLVLNARDAMPGGGRLVIETRNCEIEILHKSGTRLGCVLLVVSDNGIGMDAPTRAHVFEAFFTTKVNKGTGLGLAGVYDTVTANGGLVHVDSLPGAGTRISVLLPLAAGANTSSEHALQQASDSNQELIPMTEEA